MSDQCDRVSQNLGHLKITPGDTKEILAMIEQMIDERKGSYCIPINLTKYVVSKNDKKLTKSINDADLVIADGVPIKWLSKRARIRNVHRVTGVDLSEKLLERAEAKNWSLYFLGASPENVEKAVSRVRERFGVKQIHFRDGYFEEKDVPQIISQINEAKPDILFLGLGMPQKEYFLVDNKNKLDVPFSITVGGAIDIWADAKKRTPKLIQKVGMEWLVRSAYDLSKAKNIIKYLGKFMWDLVFYKSPEKS